VPASTHGESSCRYETFRCRYSSSCSPNTNNWIYAWSVCVGRRLNAINVMLHVNLSYVDRCSQHPYHGCTALGDENPHLTGFSLWSMFRPIHFPDPKHASGIKAP
jgi:hypothetical protein